MNDSKVKYAIITLLGIIIGLLLAFLVVYSLKSFEVKEQKKSSSNISEIANATLQLQASAHNQSTANCTEFHPYLSNEKLNEALNLLSEAVNISDIKKQYQNHQSNSAKINLTPGLLSPRVYAGVLEPRSFLITNFGPLQKDMQGYLTEQNISASIYVENLRNGANFGINEHEGYFPASLNKLPIAILIMQKIEDSKLKMDTKLPIKEYEKTDTYGTLYLTNEKELSVRELMEHMLKESDNTAFNVLFDNMDRSDLNRLLDYFNIKENTEYPFKRVEYGGGYTDLVTPIHLYNIFSSLYLSTVLYAQDSEYILSLLTVTTDFDTNYEASIPQNVSISDKFGEYYVDDSKLYHDCGIIYIDQSRIFFCIMMLNIELNDAKRTVGYFVNHLYNYVTYTRSTLDKYKQSNSNRQSNSTSNNIKY